MMERITLIGQVGARYLEQMLSVDEGGGTARFILDCLTGDQTVAITRAVLNQAELAATFEIKLPLHIGEGHGLPPHILTEERATYYRNAPCEKPALLVTNTGDDEEQSLKELVPVGAPQLLEATSLWVRIAGQTLPLTDEHRKWWEKALRGLAELHLLSLDRFAEYVLRTRQIILEQGLPLIEALGASLPALQMPRDSAYFKGLNEKHRGHTSRWKERFGAANKSRACFLSKQNTTGLLLSREELERVFKQVRESIPEEHHEVIQSFIQAPSGWNREAAHLAEREWEEIKPLFDGLRREKFNLGGATQAFYNEREPELLNGEEWDYLKRLVERRTTQADEVDTLFYESHRHELREDRKLKSAWDRFVYGSPRETDDFLVGLVSCLEFLFSHETNDARRQLTIRCERRTKKDLKELNVEAGRYFVQRYRGLRGLFGSHVTWDVGELFNFNDLIEEWGSKRNQSLARSALQLKFTFILTVSTFTGNQDRHFTQMIWKFNPATVRSEFCNDWKRLQAHPLVLCRVARESVGSKGAAQTVDLANVKSFEPSYAKDRGSFVSKYEPSQDVGKVWQNNLAQAVQQGLLEGGVVPILQESFTRFATRYQEAITGFGQDGLTHPALRQQLDAYGTLLDHLCRHARGDRNRELLLRPLMQVGTVAIEGGRATVIVAPWHPLRLAAMADKAHLVASLLKQLLTLEAIEFGDSRLFFSDMVTALSHPFYPEIVLGWHEQKPELLSLTDQLGDYTLHESPLVNPDGLDDTNENPTEAANQVFDLVKRYLTLQPHEQANLSVVLYNCDSARLPQAVVDKIGAANEDEEDVRCQIIVRHRDPKKLRTLYEKIIESIDTDADAYNASEATRDFMARLRIGIMADQAPVPDEKDGCPNDIAFLQDVIARHARVEWYNVNAHPYESRPLIPAYWSRRRPAAKDDMKSVVYLCCPVQTAAGWAFLGALTTFVKGDWDGQIEQRWLPARQLDFQDPSTARIFEETHHLANWVVNYDELLDRRQLLNQQVRIIRYKQFSTQGRNLIISSRAPLGLLRSMVLNRLRDLTLPLNAEEYEALATRLIDDANDISGDIVLRAAKHGRNASELIGVVLSRYLIQWERTAGRYVGWYFLDDYADWLGQREGYLADIMMLSPSLTETGTLHLTIVISEAKYVDAASLAAKRKESQKQLRDTIQRLHDALFGTPERLDRAFWLARLSDLLLDGIKFAASDPVNLAEWQRAIREGTCTLSIRGYSHVFVSGPSDAPEASSFAQVAGLGNAYQEVFGRSQVRELVMRYAQQQDPLPLRRQQADQDIWLPAPSSTSPDRMPLPIHPSPVSPHPPQGVESAEETGLGATLSHQEREGSQADETDTQSPQLWAYPQIGVLVAPSQSALSQPEAMQAWLEQVERRTKGALQQFQLQAKLEQSALTPNAALLKFVGSASLTVEQILKRRSEFLTTYGLNIISIQPEPGRIALSIERPERQVLSIRDIWQRWRPTPAVGNQELLVAVRENDGSLLFLSPGKLHAPHTLIAGTTGSGKSILLQNIILAIAATNTPQEARITLIDPKQGVDYFQLEPLPHLTDGVIDQPDIALEKLQALVIEMDERYTRFKASRSPNLALHNQKVSPSERLPVIWLIHDEFAEWMLIEEYKQSVTALVGRLGSKARAAGIYLIFAAQRPDANVMPMQLRANLGNRLILRVDSEGTSELALGERGAERLLGRGHLIAKLEGAAGVTYAQVPFVETEFMDQVVSTICGSP